MLEKKIIKTRQLLINEIVETLEYLAYLKNEVKAPVKMMILKYQARKMALLAELKAIDLLAY